MSLRGSSGPPPLSTTHARPAWNPFSSIGRPSPMCLSSMICSIGCPIYRMRWVLSPGPRDEVIEATSTARAIPSSGARMTAAQNQLLARHVANTHGPLSAESIVRTLVELQGNGLPHASSWQMTTSWLQSAARKAAVRAKRTIRRDKTLAAYMNQKFPGLSLAEVENVFRAIDAVHPHATSLRIEAHPRLPYCFVISTV